MLTFLILSLTLVDPTPKIPIGKETTYVNGPLDDEGYIRYDAALNAMLSQGVTPQNNANVPLVQALGPKPEGVMMPEAYFQALGIAQPPIEGDYFVDLGKFLKSTQKLDPSDFTETYMRLWEACIKPWTVEQHPEVAAWLQQIDKPLNLVQRGMARPRYFNPIVSQDEKPLLSALLPTAQKSRELAGAFKMRAMLRIQQGNYDAAWADILATHRLARHLSQGSTLIESLVGYALNAIAQNSAIRLIQAENVTTKQLQSWLADLEQLPPFQPYHELLDRGERMFALDAIQAIIRDPSCMDDKISFELDVRNVDWPVVFKTFNGYMNQAVKVVTIDSLATMPPDLKTIQKTLDAIEPDPKQIAPMLQLFMSPKERGKYLGEVYYRLFAPALAKVLGAYIRAQQTHELETIAFRLAIHNLARGSYPKQLAEMKLATKPIDLYTGKPLVYMTTADGYKLYSVGLNQTDDASQTFSSEPRGDDLVVTVPIPKEK